LRSPTRPLYIAVTQMASSTTTPRMTQPISASFACV
jgi:hypothetical protein